MVIVEEWSGSSPQALSITATITSPSPSSIHIERSVHRLNQVWARVLGAFVPEGFPNSVTPDYACFQFWDSLQGLSTYIRTMLSTQALLSAIGVGEKSATVIGATFQWFLRDLTGMIGGIVFTLFQGSNLDSNAKMWRLTADFMNDLGMLMDLVSPLFPSTLVFVVCLGSISRSFTGVASGATRAALTQHFSLQNNAADISAKEGSQETVATMVGMAFGMILARITMGHSLCIWFSFLFLTIFHLYANYMAVRCLLLNTLNSGRSSILLQHFMETGQVLSPKQVSMKEPVLPLWMMSLFRSKSLKSQRTQIHLGLKVSSLDYIEMMDLLNITESHYKTAMYVLFVRKRVINIVIHKDARAANLLQSFLHALVLGNLLEGFTGRNVLEECNSRAMHEASRSWIHNHYDHFLVKLRLSGWSTERLLAQSVVWKADWRCGSGSQKTD